MECWVLGSGLWVLGSLVLGLDLGSDGLKKCSLGMTNSNLATYHHLDGCKQGIGMLERCTRGVMIMRWDPTVGCAMTASANMTKEPLRGSNASDPTTPPVATERCSGSS